MLLAFDIETDGLDPYKGARAFAFAVCDINGNITVSREPKNIQSYLIKGNQLICHNYHFEYSILQEQGFKGLDKVEWHDTMIMHQLLFNIARAHSLDVVAEELSKNYSDRKRWKEIDKQIAKAAKIFNTYDKIPIDLMTTYQSNDVERTMLIFQAMYPLIQADERLHRCYLDEIEIVWVTIEFEKRGMMISRQEAQKLLQWMDGELAKVDDEVYQLFKSYINLNSTKQLTNLLFNQLAIPPVSLTEKGNNAIDNEVITNLLDQFHDNKKIHTVLDLVLRCRAYTKGKAMVSSYIKAAGEAEIIHPHINTNRAQTGRESSSNPNMQNISKEISPRTFYPIPARRCFRARPGYVLYFADYSGIEMRLIIELTGEPELVELIKKNGDPHDLAAQLFYGAQYTSITDKIQKKTKRSAAKNSQFALAYGAQLPKIALSLGLTEQEAKPGYEAYCKRFPKIAGFMPKLRYEAKVKGFVITSFGRKLFIRQDHLMSGANYIIQGTAAGIIKRAQINCHQYLEQWWPEIHILLPIHDEIIFEVPRNIISKQKSFITGLREQMINIPEINVPLDVEWKMSTLLWSQAKEIKI
jgi:DNA polymerase I